MGIGLSIHWRGGDAHFEPVAVGGNKLIPACLPACPWTGPGD